MPSWPSTPLVVVAVGGNAIMPAGSRGAQEDQWRAVRGAAEPLARLAETGVRLLITHGNGPQVGLSLQRSALAEREVPPLSMDVAVAGTQGELGYAFARALADAQVARSGEDRPVIALVTQVEVAADDPAFEAPSKPIGRFLTKPESRALAEERGWTMKRVAPGPRGWRRVVASPEPMAVVELEGIRGLLNAGAIVIAGGGGGVPVVRTRDLLAGVAAVIDKDRVSALLATQLGAETLLIATGVERVALDFGLPGEQMLDEMKVSEARRYLALGQFPAGSMGPKVEALVGFVEAGGGRALITDLDHMREAWQGRAGTSIVPDDRK